MNQWKTKLNADPFSCLLDSNKWIKLRTMIDLLDINDLKISYFKVRMLADPEAVL